MAKKCPYYDKIRSDPSKLKKCPVAAGCPHAAKSGAGEFKDAVKKCPHLSGSGADGESKSGCPVSEKCPYYAAHKGEHAGQKGCPLEKGDCPYYKRHAKDHSAEDIIAADSAAACPMDKCPYFKVRCVL